MAKVNYSQAEIALEKTLKTMLMQNLESLASIGIEIKAGKLSLTPEEVEFILNEFRLELKKMQKLKPSLYQQLHLSAKEEEELFLFDLKKIDWNQIIALRDKFLALGSNHAHSSGQQKMDSEEIVEEKRKKEKNRRFNVKKGWIPLD